jgi:DNA-binding XRE family transcriptional regulator
MERFFQNERDVKLFTSLSNTQQKLDKYIVMLKNDFGYSLSKSQLAQLLDVSEQTLDRRIKEACNIPQYFRSGNGAKASYIFPIVEVAEYLANHTIKVA